jgi:tetratricopeptide (TPR) repeat protein
MKNLIKNFDLGIRAVLVLMLLFTVICLSYGNNKNEIPVTCSVTSTESLTAFISGREAFEMGRLKDANALFDKAIQLDNQFALAYLYKAYNAVSKSEWEKYIDLATKNSNRVSEGEKIMIQMESALSIKDGKERLVLAKRLVELYPQSSRARLILAAEYQSRKDFTKVRELARDAIQLNADSPLGYRMLATSYFINKPQDFSLAQNYMEQYREMCPNEPASHIALGDVYRAQLMWDLALQSYSKAITLDPNSSIAYAKRGYVNIYQGYFDNARNDWKLANDLTDVPMISDPFQSVVSYLYGSNGQVVAPAQAMMIQANHTNGKRHPLEAPEDDHYFCCTVISMKHGVYVSPYGDISEQEALKRELAQESIAPRPQMVNANITFLESIHALMQDDFEMATLKAKQHALIIAPDLKPQKLQVYNYLIGLIDLKQKRYSQAVDHYRKSDLNNACVKYELGLAYDALGEWQNAQELFDQVSKYSFGAINTPYMSKISKDWLDSYATLPKEE